MKKILLYKPIILVVLLAALLSCSDKNLEVVPFDQLSDANVWKDASTADLFLNDIYQKLPDGNNFIEPFENYSDNSMGGFGFIGSRVLEDHSSYTPTEYPRGAQTLNIFWDIQYSYIRKCNVFIGNVASSALPETYKKKRIAEARVLRAYFYQLLWMCYGGVPIITEPLDHITQGEGVYRARSTAAETAQFIITECGQAAADLPPINEVPRITKGAALTLKGWVELYFASPLYNPGNDKTRWAQASATNRQVIESGVYTLYPDYGKLFLPPGNVNNEGILFRQYFPRLNGGRLSRMGTPFTKNGAQTGQGSVNPTQELVDDYAMNNGLPITDPASGYDPQKPYMNREKRFYESIVHDGSFWFDDTIYTRLGVGSRNQLDLSDASDATNTGYNLRKRMDPNIPLGADNWKGGTSSQNYYYFRYAEVLLSYAEAQNEAVGPDASVYDAINLVRKRTTAAAYLPPLTPGLTQEQMRTAIRRERRVELAFEDKRRWDILRWKVAAGLYQNGLHAMKIEKINGILKYTVIQAPDGTRSFEEKNYLFPIPQQVLDQNPVIRAQNGGPDRWNNGQNPGY